MKLTFSGISGIAERIERAISRKADEHDIAVGEAAAMLAEPMPSDPEEFAKEYQRRTKAGLTVPTIRTEAGELLFLTADEPLRIES